MPTLYILGGPNGAGKTTWFNTAVEEGFIYSELSFINADLIALKELGGYSEVNFAKAEAIVRERIGYHIQKKESFMTESNLARSADYDWIEALQKSGYDFILYFLCTDDVDINKYRIKTRVKEGGHEVAESIIEHRYKMGLPYIKAKVLGFKEAFLIDNSQEISRIMAILNNGKVIKKQDGCPTWVTDVIFIAERIRR